MDDTVSIQLLAAFITAVAVMAFAYTLIYPMLSPEPLEKRLNAVKDSKKQETRSPLESAAARRKQVSDTLKDIEGRNKSSEKVTLRQSLERAGLGSDPKAFFLASAAAAGITIVLILLFAPTSGMKYVYVALGGIAAGFGLPRFVLKKLIARRQNKFLDELANALDIIVRGVKSGLPLNDCLQIIANESPEPISGEFREVIEQQRVGVPLGEALERMTVRVPLQEAKFFAIVVAIQQQAGGNLAEALNNLSGVLRDRVRMKSKVQALSSEAKASAMILGSLPPGVMAMLWLSTPDYVAPLITTKAGNLLILGGLFWMGLGILMMQKMINFKF